jgi:hypothetical protein
MPAQEQEVPRGFEPRSLDSESRVLTVTTQDQVSVDLQEMHNLHTSATDGVAPAVDHT